MWGLVFKAGKLIVKQGTKGVFKTQDAAKAYVRKVDKYTDPDALDLPVSGYILKYIVPFLLPAMGISHLRERLRADQKTKDKESPISDTRRSPGALGGRRPGESPGARGGRIESGTNKKASSKKKTEYRTGGTIKRTSRKTSTVRKGGAIKRRKKK